MEKDFDNNNENCIEFLSGNIMRLLLSQTENISIVLKIFILIEKMNSNI